MSPRGGLWLAAGITFAIGVATAPLLTLILVASGVAAYWWRS